MRAGLDEPKLFMQTTIKYGDIPRGERNRLTAEVSKRAGMRLLQAAGVGVSVLLLLYVCDFLFPMTSSQAGHALRAGLAGGLSVPLSQFLLSPLVRREVEKAYVS